MIQSFRGACIKRISCVKNAVGMEQEMQYFPTAGTVVFACSSGKCVEYDCVFAHGVLSYIPNVSHEDRRCLLPQLQSCCCNLSSTP
ncbi:hypothetical protein GOODEAATRI_022406, partial [Goodea atripinnis]